MLCHIAKRDGSWRNDLGLSIDDLLVEYDSESAIGGLLLCLDGCAYGNGCCGCEKGTASRLLGVSGR